MQFRRQSEDVIISTLSGGFYKTFINGLNDTQFYSLIQAKYEYTIRCAADTKQNNEHIHFGQLLADCIPLIRSADRLAGRMPGGIYTLNAFRSNQDFIV
jgi:hypothetical protein